MVRLAAAASALWALGDKGVVKLLAVPFRDLAGAVVWLAGLGGNTVEWRGTPLRLHRDGRMQPF
jgi:hypothetical protein